MKPTFLSPLELKQYSLQIAASKAGIEGQEKLKYSEVVINGIGGISIIVLRCLTTAGIGNVKLVDNRTVTKEMLPSQTLLNIKDVGKLRTVAVREKYIGENNGSNIEIINGVINNNNIKSILGNAKMVVDAMQNIDTANNLINLANEQDFYLAGGFGVNWQGAYGIYRCNNTKRYMKQVGEFFNRLHPYDTEQPYFGFISNIIGGAIAEKLIKTMLNIDDNDSVLYEVDMLNFNIQNRLNNNFT